MKNLIIGLIMVLVMSGCSTTYGVGKVIYKGAKTAYIELELENENIERIDNVLVVYDEVRTAVVGEVTVVKKQKRASVSSSQTHD